MSKTFYVFKKFANLKKSQAFVQNQNLEMGKKMGGSAQFLEMNFEVALNKSNVLTWKMY